MCFLCKSLSDTNVNEILSTISNEMLMVDTLDTSLGYKHRKVVVF